jgi:hypothetical protein
MVASTSIKGGLTMWTRYFWLSAAERAIKTFAQTLLVIWPVGDATLHLYDLDWRKAVLTAGLAAAASLLTSIVSGPVGPDGSPSLVGEPPKQPAELLDPADTAPMGRHELDDEPADIPASKFTEPRATRYDDER